MVYREDTDVYNISMLNLFGRLDTLVAHCTSASKVRYFIFSERFYVALQTHNTDDTHAIDDVKVVLPRRFHHQAEVDWANTSTRNTASKQCNFNMSERGTREKQCVSQQRQQAVLKL